MVTLREPVAATSSIVIGTEALVGPFTVKVPAVMSEPKLTVVVGPKLVLVPVITIVSLDPWCAEDGFRTAVAVYGARSRQARSAGDWGWRCWSR